MLLVRTKIAPSQIHGFGLFADQFIAKGEVIWRFSPGFDLEKTVEELATLPVHIQEWFKHCAYLDYHFDRYVLCTDNARFVNHSETPSMYSDYGQDNYGPDVAIHDIKAGEELTNDYTQFDMDWIDNNKR
jgi:SET domain-containing protein